MRKQFSTNPTRQLQEIEVFCGFVFDPSGVLKGRKWDNSIAMRDEFDRVTQLIVAEMRNPGPEPSGGGQVVMADTGSAGDGASNSNVEGDGTSGKASKKPFVSNFWTQKKRSIELCWRCLEISFGQANDKSGQSNEPTELASFRIVAAATLLREVNQFMKRCDQGESK